MFAKYKIEIQLPLLLVAIITSFAFALPNVQPLLESLAAKSENKINIRVLFRNDRSESILEEFETKRSSGNFQDDSHEKENEFYRTFKKHADETQRNTTQILQTFISERAAGKNSISPTFRQMWIINQLFIWNADTELIKQLGTIEDVSSIQEEIVYELDKDFKPEIEEVNISFSPIQRDSYSSSERLLWNLEEIQAPKVWAAGRTGKGAVVGIIDSGVRKSHEALYKKFRSDHGWYDPYTKKEAPFDPIGHGTLVAGIIIGSNGIGVAPEAQWIACRGTDTGNIINSLDTDICMEWMVCPTDPKGNNMDCSKKPNVINNSWGFLPGVLSSSPTKLHHIKSWLANNIVPVFAIGNSGPNCSTVVAPGIEENVIGVGATTSSRKVWERSSVGPIKLKDKLSMSTKTTARIKPDVVAPGSHILSAWYFNDMFYSYSSGTSLAAPHVTGLAAIYFGQFPKGTGNF